MNYPLISDYISSLYDAEDNLSELSNLTPVLDGSRTPIMSSGNFAVVFKMEDDEGNYYAIKCFLKDVPHRRESYRLISEELEYVSSSFLTSVRYLEDEFFVDSNNTNTEEFPVLLMDWVEGVTLDAYIRAHLHDRHTLAILSFQFGRLASWLLSQPFAHGDLKPDNILVKPDGTLCLVDYDGMFVPSMKGSESPELGTPDFRHPLRTVQQFNEHIDDFSLATMALSLKAISLDPSLLERTGASEGLLFFDKDYRDLGSSVMLQQVASLLADAELATLYSLFILAFAKQELSAVSHRLFLLERPSIVVGMESKNPTTKDLTFKVNGVSFEMIHVDDGTFQMGATFEQGSDAWDNEIPVHQVKISRAFRMTKYPVTQKQWETVMGNNPSIFKLPDAPVDSVTWNDCVKFTEVITEKCGLNLSLPTEAQWEFAARGGNLSRNYKFAGNDNLGDIAWYALNTKQETKQVGLKQPNELGFFDMSGNVWEWCLDWYNTYSSRNQEDPLFDKQTSLKVIRGGSWKSGKDYCRVSSRQGLRPLSSYNYIGLRLVENI